MGKNKIMSKWPETILKFVKYVCFFERIQATPLNHGIPT